MSTDLRSTAEKRVLGKARKIRRLIKFVCSAATYESSLARDLLATDDNIETLIQNLFASRFSGIEFLSASSRLEIYMATVENVLRERMSTIRQDGIKQDFEARLKDLAGYAG
jgi:hypothetical protein